MSIQQIADELVNDPLNRNYSAMTDQQVVDSMNTANISVARSRIPTQEIADAFAPSDKAAISANAAVIAMVLAPDTIDPSGWARDVLLDVFTAGSATRTNLAALTTENITRGQQIGHGEVLLGHVEMARARIGG